MRRLTYVPSPLSEQIAGSPLADRLAGLDGDDRLSGGAGDDFFLEGWARWTEPSVMRDGEIYLQLGSLHLFGRGSDTIDGGAGHDIVSYKGVAEGLRVDMTRGWVSTATGTDQLSRIEELWLSDGHDTVIGHGRMEVMLGGGSDLVQLNGFTRGLHGGDGRDVLELRSGAATKIEINLSDDSITWDGRRADVTGFEVFRAYGNLGITFIGNFGGEQFWGGAGNDTVADVGPQSRIFTGAGADNISGIGGTIDAGSGNDTITGNGGTYIAGYGDDTIIVERFAELVRAGFGADRLVLNAADIFLTAFMGPGSDTVEINGDGEFSGRLAGNGGSDDLILNGTVGITLGLSERQGLPDKGVTGFDDIYLRGASHVIDGKTGPITIHGSTGLYELSLEGHGIDIEFRPFDDVPRDDGHKIYLTGSGNVETGAGADLIGIAYNGGKATKVQAGGVNDRIHLVDVDNIDIQAEEGDDGLYLEECFAERLTAAMGRGHDTVSAFSDFTLIDLGTGNDMIETHEGVSGQIILGGGSTCLSIIRVSKRQPSPCRISMSRRTRLK